MRKPRAERGTPAGTRPTFKKSDRTRSTSEANGKSGSASMPSKPVPGCSLIGCAPRPIAVEFETCQIVDSGWSAQHLSVHTRFGLDAGSPEGATDSTWLCVNSYAIRPVPSWRALISHRKRGTSTSCGRRRCPSNASEIALPIPSRVADFPAPFSPTRTVRRSATVKRTSAPRASGAESSKASTRSGGPTGTLGRRFRSAAMPAAVSCPWVV